ncbi:MAG: aldo/keto reductase [bacterium]|nr:aldo/keto reductase [bacterium]
MHHRPLGKTGLQISALGFGAMRLPMQRRGGAEHVRVREAVRLMRHAYASGINYVDTAYGYCAGESEAVVGKAVRGLRDQLIVSTKLPVWQVKKRADFMRLLEEQLRRLALAHVDIYYLHGIGAASLHNTILKHHLLDEAEKARRKGLIRFLSFSFHDKPEAMKEIIDTGAFASVLCQYNLLDRANEAMMAYAKAQGLGVIVMGPVGGGRLGHPGAVIRDLLPKQAVSSPELALRFVLSNPNVDCALSGMSAVAQVDENVCVAAQRAPLSAREQNHIRRVMDKLQHMARLYCTGCGYCLPCPHEVRIPECFEAMNLYRVYGLLAAAQARYTTIGNWPKGRRADACTQCGSCEAKCPQHIQIRAQLAEVRRALGGENQ